MSEDGTLYRCSVTASFPGRPGECSGPAQDACDIEGSPPRIVYAGQAACDARDLIGTALRDHMRDRDPDSVLEGWEYPEFSDGKLVSPMLRSEDPLVYSMVFHLYGRGDSLEEVQGHLLHVLANKVQGADGKPFFFEVYGAPDGRPAMPDEVQRMRGGASASRRPHRKRGMP